MNYNRSIEFIGEYPKVEFYKILDILDMFKSNGWKFYNHVRKELDNGNIYIHYKIVKY